MPVIASVQQASRTSPLVLPWRLNDRLQGEKKCCIGGSRSADSGGSATQVPLSRRTQREEHCESAIGEGEEDDNNGFAGTKRMCVRGGRRKW